MKVIKPIAIEDDVVDPNDPVSDGSGGLCLTDSARSNVVLLLHGEAIVDSSPNVKSMSAFGGASASTTQKKFGTKSIAVLNSGDYLSTPSSTDFNFTGDFTIECWVHRTVIKGAYAQGILTRRVYNNVGSGTWRLMDDGFQNLENPAKVIGFTLPYNTWIHLAITRASGIVKAFVHGVAGSSMTDTTNFTCTEQLLVGRDWDSSSTTAFGGYIDEVRITNGVARYTTSFTPPVYANCNFAPEAIVGGAVDYSSLLEPTIGIDPAAWVSGTSYLLGNTVYLPSTHKVYQALSNITADTVSPDTSILLAIPKWVEIGSTNKFAMFDLYRNTPSIFTTDTIIPRTVAGTLEVVNSAKVSVDVVSTDTLSIALLNLVNVGRVIVQCVDNTTSAIISTISYDINTRDVYDWWTYFTTQFVPKKSLVLDTLPIGYSDMKVIVYFLGSPDIEVGSFILGTSTYIGMLQQGSELDVVNFSTMERDLFGNATLVPRRSISSLKGELFIPKEIYEDVMNIKEELDAIPALWVGIEDIEDNYYQSLLLFGIYRDFNFKLDNPIGVVANLELEEM